MKTLFAERLTELLEEKNISKRECARLTNISAQSISDWSTGKISPTAENILTLSVFFNVTTDFLLGIEEYNIKTIKKSNESLTKQEQELLSMFAFLDEDEKGKILDDCKYFYNKHINKNTSQKRA